MDERKRSLISETNSTTDIKLDAIEVSHQKSFNSDTGPGTDFPYNNSNGENPTVSTGTSRYAKRIHGNLYPTNLENLQQPHATSTLNCR